MPLNGSSNGWLNAHAHTTLMPHRKRQKERERAKSPHIQLLRDSAAGDRKQEKNTIKKNPFEKAAEKNKS